VNLAFYLITAVSSLYFLFAVFIVLGRRKPKVLSTAHKRISLLIPARNEARDLPRVLSSIAKLDYPAELLEVVLVNHKSTDDTLKLMREFAVKSPFRVKIVSVMEGADCKAAALRAGIAAANGDFLAFTDAEARFEADWLKKIAISCGNNTLAGGPIIIEGDDFFARMQNLDWLHFFAAGSGFAGWGIPQSVFGKNMLIDRKLFTTAGGFSEGMVWTEDLELAERCKKWGKIALFPATECAVYSLPEPTAPSFFRQKIRWLKGSANIDSWGLSVMITALVMDLTILFAAFNSIALFLWAWLLKSLADVVVLTGLLYKLNLRKDIWLVPFYSLFAAIYRIALLLIYPLAQNPRWRQ